MEVLVGTRVLGGKNASPSCCSVRGHRCKRNNPSTPEDDADSFYIGKGRVSGADYPFDGAIDNVMIFDRTLLPDEIEAFYNEGGT